MAIHDEIYKKHEETFGFLISELNDISKDWQEIVKTCIERTGHGNPLHLERSTSDYYMDFSPEMLGFERMGLNVPNSIRLRFNLGDITKSPLMVLGLYVDLNLNAFENQKYQVVSAYIPINSVSPFPPVLSMQSGIKNFDYSSSGIRLEMLKELTKQFDELNNVLNSSYD